MNRRPAVPSLLALGAIASIAACGARSSLVDGSRAEGSGGASSSAGSSSGAGGITSSSSSGITIGSSSSGTGGGPVVICTFIVASSSIVTVEDSSADLVEPQLVNLPGPAGRTALVFAKQPVGNSAPTVEVAAFDGWGAWPPPPLMSVSLMGENEPILGIAIQAASLNGDPAKEEFALFYASGMQGKGLLTAEARAGGSTGFTMDVVGGEPLALVPDEAMKQVFSARSHVESPFFGIELSYVDAFGGANIFGYGCATTPIAAGAAGRSYGFITGAALGTPPNPDAPGFLCKDVLADIKPAQFLTFSRLETLTNPITYSWKIGEIEATQTPVTRLRMAPSDQGAWAVWAEEGNPSLRIATLDDDPAFVLPPQDLPSFSGITDPASFDVARIGGRLLVGALESSPNGPVVSVGLVEAGGFNASATSIKPEGKVFGPVALLVAPASAEALVAWSELADGAFERRIRVARLICEVP